MNVSHVLEPQAVIVPTVMIPPTPVLSPLVRKEINLDFALEIRQGERSRETEDWPLLTWSGHFGCPEAKPGH